MKKQLKPLTDKEGEVRFLTKTDMRRFRPTYDVGPALVVAYKSGTLRYRGQRGKQKAPTKVVINLRVSPEVLDFFKSKGAGWQTRMNNALQAIVDVAR